MNRLFAVSQADEHDLDSDFCRITCLPCKKLKSLLIRLHGSTRLGATESVSN
jgi:hypothetical protein